MSLLGMMTLEIEETWRHWRRRRRGEHFPPEKLVAIWAPPVAVAHARAEARAGRDLPEDWLMRLAPKLRVLVIMSYVQEVERHRLATE